MSLTMQAESMNAVNVMRAFESRWRLDIKDIVLTIYVSVLNFVDIFPFHAKSLKAATIMRLFDDGLNN